MTCFTTRHIQRGGVRATFFNSEGAKINDSLGPRVFDLLDTPLLTYIMFQLQCFMDSAQADTDLCQLNTDIRTKYPVWLFEKFTGKAYITVPW